MPPIIDSICFVGRGRHIQFSVVDLLVKMDQAGIHKALICPVEECVCVYNQQGNNLMLEQVSSYPDRLAGYATVNPWYGEAAVKELRRALSQGLRGVYLNSALQGYFIHDELVYPVIEVAEEFHAPVYFHTATPIYALPFQLAELARNFPAVDFIMGHMAAADYWTDAVPAARMSDNIYIETSIRSGIATLRQAVQELGAPRILFGSSAPLSDPAIELAKVRMVGLPPQEEELVLGGNMLRLLTQAGEGSP